MKHHIASYSFIQFDSFITMENPFRQFHSFELVLFNAKFSTIKLVSRTNLIYKKQFRIFFWFVNPFQIIFCKFLVGVDGLEPTKESELQRLPPYQLGYTPRFRPLLNYQLLAFLGLASVLTLSELPSPLKGERFFFVSLTYLTIYHCWLNSRG